MAIAIFCLAADRSHSGVAFAVGGVLAIGGIVLVAKAWWWFCDFKKLMMEGKRHDVWISLHGNRSDTSFLAKVYLSETALEASLSFLVNENPNLRSILESRQKAKAVLLKRDRHMGMVIVYIDGEMILPSGDVRYVK